MGLTKRDKDELNKAILEYLYSNNYKNSYDAFVSEAEIDSTEDSSKHKNVLETKWKSLARLKRQVQTLEDQIRRYKEENDAKAIYGGQKEGLPKQPEKFVCSGHQNKVNKVAFHPIYDILASGSDDASIKLWDTETGENDKTMKGHTKKINHIAFNNQGTFLASGSYDLTIRLWNLEIHQGTKAIQQAHEHNISGLKYMPSGDQILSSSWDNTIKIWDCSTGYGLKTFKGHESWVTCIDVNSKGTGMVSGSKGQEIIYWDLNLKTDKSIITIFEEEHENIIDVVIFAPLETAKTIIKAKNDPENEEDKENENADEEEKAVRADTNGDVEEAILTPAQKKKADLDKLREKKAKLK